MNVKGRVYKKIFKKEKGVSEVLGSILVLLITVMLFSTVFYYVGTMPTPQPKIYAQFDATLHIVPNGTGGYCLNITVRNVGGESLVDWRTMFIVVIDFTAKQHMLSEPHFSKQPFDKDGKFSQGESFYYNSSWDGWNWPHLEDTKYLDVGITLMDKNTGSIIWSSKLQGRTSLPPVLVGVTTTPSIPILGKPATFKAIIFNPNTGGDVGTYNVTLDFSQTILKYSIEGSPIKPMNYSGNNAFTTLVRFKTNDSLNILRPYKIKVWVNNGYSNISYSTNIYVSRGTGNKNPDLYIDSKLVTLSTLSPTHGNNVQVSVTVENLGGTGAKFQLRVLDQYPGYRSASNPSGEITIKTNLGSSEYLPDRDTTYTIAAAGQTTISFIWEDVGANSQGNNVVSKVSGTHHLIFQIINITPVENPNKYPDTASVSLTVLPSILLVDDDGYAEGSPWDTSRYYKYYLDTAGYKYTVDKSSIDIGQLKRDVDSHDLVIWETGYKENPITSAQASILEDFVFNRGGSLWLISQEISQGNLRTILADSYLTPKSTNMGNIKGIENPAINLTLSNGSLIMDDLMNRDHAPNGNDTIYLSNMGSYKKFIEAKEEGSTGNRYFPVGIYKDSSSTGGGKIVYLGFELSRVKHYYAQDFIAYRILKWLANISGRAGNDLAVEDMIIEPRNPLYKEPVHISVVVSNNGGTALSSEVLLEVDGAPSLNINTTNPNSTGVIPPDGGFVVVNFTWIPTQPGKHVLTAIVDPYNTIEETNEENNVINTEIVDTNVFVHYSTLIVYNSSQTNSINEKNALVVTLQHLGYRYKVIDSHSANLPYGYDDGTYFAQYNLVIWADGKIGKGDIKAIIDSMSNNPNTGQLFIGNDIMAYIDDSSKLKNYLEITSINLVNVNKKSVIYGINNVKSETNGMTLILQSTTMYNITATGAQGLFHLTKSTDTGYMTLEKLASQYSNTISGYGYGIVSKTPVSGSKFGIIPFKLENIAGIFGLKAANIAKPYDPAPQGQAWLMYRLFRWFGYVKDTPEFATFTSDIQIIYGGNNPNLPPIIGRSYMLRTKVYNYGSVGASAVVRFYDDYEWIGSKTVYVPANNYAQVEIQWTPMFAGPARHIRVIVDPLNEVTETQFNGTSNNGKEIFNFNNEAIKTVTVYYFWDNMENGAGNWVHEATVMDINGESPLNFVNRKDVSTNVIGDWDWSLSGSTDSNGNYHQDENTFYTNDTKVLNFTGGAHHSAPNAFWMPEAPRINKRKPIDVIFVIDTSGSMNSVVRGATVGDVNGDGKANTRIDVAIQAALDAIKLLGPNDRVAIFSFDTLGNKWWKPTLKFTYVTKENLPTIEDTLTGLRASGGTPLYDTLSWAVYYMDKKSADNVNRENAVRGILVLTDGLSNSDIRGVRDGRQFYYAPGTGYDEEETGVIENYVKYKSSGLLKIPYNLIAISIAPDGWDGRLFPIGNSSQGRISMGLFENDPVVIQEVFTMFVQLLMQQTTGGLRATPPIGSYKNDLNLQGSLTIQGLGAVVFSDGFRNYTNYPGDASTPGFLGKWKESGFTIASTNDGNYYYKGQSDGASDEYWVAQTDTSGAYLQHTVYPSKVLKYHYPGTYTIKGAEIRFWVGDHGDVGGYFFYPDGSKATINIYIDGQLISSEKFDDSSGNNPEEYFTVQLPVSVYSSGGSFDFKIEISSISGTIGIDDVMVVYYIDYTPPTSNSGGGGTIPSDYSSVVNTATNYTYLITPPVDVSGAQKVLLSFWTKYWMTQGTNGGIMYMWGSNDETSWTWDQTHRYYIMPSQSYTGNLDPRYFDSNWANNVITSGGPVINGRQNGMADATYTGSGTTGLPMWCFNGRSGSGTFGWDYIEVDLTHYIRESGFKYIRIVFMLVQFGGVGPNSGWNPAMGWYLDDVKISVTSDGNRDLWQLHNFGGTGAEKAHSGDYAWAYGESNSNWALPKGVDSSLITKQIDLTNARTARLSFWIRFNLNSAAGVPPATVRVEVSDDNGMTWQSITYGVRIGWGASGTGSMAGTSANNNYGWVNSGTLARINCDLSGWAGKSIMIRFRVVTNATEYPTYANSNDPYGVFIDDVVVSGEGYASTIPVSQSDYLWDGGTLTNVKSPHKIPNKQSNNIKDKNIEINIHLRGERPDHHHVGPIEMMHALPIIQPFLIRIAVVRNF
ncbi:Mg-chelatase subunit ChlD [Aciduliprofundum sp. MAR08-339]|uniref:CARDB domain-containing protein n=1 Tax=Aciduliprofundum sp. (strain MAR08-339) TaxID=673860 RepID=UPI0002A4A0C0|nr:Mg-chelatase subunit ChlD [Aciduliprofundum sp. MAR08-339]